MKERLVILSIFLFAYLIIIKNYYIDTDISLYEIKNTKQTQREENVWLISFASHDFHIQNQNNMIISSRLYQGAFDIIIPYQPKDIEPEYYEKHKDILSQRRGAGYWLWKPYFILKTLNMMPENDILLYVDSSGVFRDNVYKLLNLARNHDVVVFPNFHENRSYIKKLAIDKMMNGDESYLDKKQLDANVVLLKNTPQSREVIAEWLKYCEDAELLTDVPSENEYEDFKDHRHDQAILTLLYYLKPENFYLNNYSTYQMGAYEVIRRRNNDVSMLPLTYHSFWGIWTYIKIKFIDRIK